jgi:hypothetical protein
MAKKKEPKPTEGILMVGAFFGVIAFLLFSSIFINFLKGNENFQDKVTDFGTIPGEVIPWILFAMVCSSAYWIYECVKQISKIRKKRRKK